MALNFGQGSRGGIAYLIGKTQSLPGGCDANIRIRSNNRIAISDEAIVRKKKRKSRALGVA
jgi:glutamate synthase domain-containing protein 3